MTNPVLTIFTTPKPFTDPHINIIQRNAIRCWQQLGEVEVFIVGDETGCAQVADEFGVFHLPHVARSAWGTPLVSDIFRQAQEKAHSPLMFFTNADMLYTPQVIEAARVLLEKYPQFLLIGQRWDIDLQQLSLLDDAWSSNLEVLVKKSGKLHLPSGSDYFIFPKGMYAHIPNFAIGRSGWDNWMIYEAHCSKFPLIDGSLDVLAVHQNHDYRHLPQGKPHYNLEESRCNIGLAGGTSHLFTLLDAEWQVRKGKLERPRFSWLRLLRRAELAVQPSETKQGKKVRFIFRKWLARRFRRLRRRMTGSL